MLEADSADALFGLGVKEVVQHLSRAASEGVLFLRLSERLCQANYLRERPLDRLEGAKDSA